MATGAPRTSPQPSQRDVLASILARPDVQRLVSHGRAEAARRGVNVVVRIPVRGLVRDGAPVHGIKILCHPPPHAGLDVAFDMTEAPDAAGAAAPTEGARGGAGPAGDASSGHAASAGAASSPPPPPPAPVAAISVDVVEDAGESAASVPAQSDVVSVRVEWRVVENAASAERFVMQFALASDIAAARAAARASADAGGAGGKRRGKKGRKKQGGAGASAGTAADGGDLVAAKIAAAFREADGAATSDMMPTVPGSDDAPVRRCVLTDVERGAEYVFRVCYANDAAEDAALIECGSTTLTTPPGRPSIPGPPCSAGATRTGLKVRWAKADERGSPISEYVVQMASVGSIGDDATAREAHMRFTEIYRGEEAMCSVSRLLPGSRFAFRVSAANGIGVSDWTEPVELSTNGSVPLPPVDLRTRDAEARSVHVEWRPPLRSNGSPVTGYVLEVCCEARSSDFMPAYNGANLSYHHTGLEPVTLYRYRVKACNALGQSEWSEVVECQTAGCAPDAPPPLRIARETSKRRREDSDTVRLTWDAADGSVFRVQLAAESGGGFAVVYEGPGPSCVLADLDPGGRYSARLCAGNEYGWSEYSDVLSFSVQSTVPAVPDAPTVKVVKANEVSLSWEEPALHGSSLRGYEVSLRHVGPVVPPQPDLPARHPRTVARRPANHPSWQLTSSVQLPVIKFDDAPVAARPGEMASPDDLAALVADASAAEATSADADDSAWRVGDSCDALYASDGLWYAGVIIALEGEMASVSFTGYGNTESMHVDDLRRRLRVGSSCEAVSPEEEWHSAVVAEVLAEGYTVCFESSSSRADVPSAAVRGLEQHEDGGAGAPSLTHRAVERSQAAAGSATVGAGGSWSDVLLRKADVGRATKRPVHRTRGTQPAAAVASETVPVPIAVKSPVGSGSAVVGGAGGPARKADGASAQDASAAVDGAIRVVYRGQRRSCVVSGLVAGHDYVVTVSCENEVGSSGPSAESQFSTAPAAPDPPSHVRVETKSTTALEVVVGDVPDVHGMPLKAWRVQVADGEAGGSGDAKPGARVVFLEPTVLAEPRGTVRDLRSGAVYWVRAAAENDAGLSSWSTPVCARTLASPPSPPPSVSCTGYLADDVGAVEDAVKAAVGDAFLRLSNAGERSSSQVVDLDAAVGSVARPMRPGAPRTDATRSVLVASWDAPDEAHGAALLRYDAELSVRGAGDDRYSDWSCVYSGPSSELALLAPPAGGSVRVRVAAVNSEGAGPFCEAASLKAEAVPPGVVRHVDVGTITHSTIQLSWREPASGGARVASYVVQRLALSGDEDVIPESPAASSVVEANVRQRSHHLKKLAAGSRYALRVAAANVVGVGPFSEWRVIETLAAPAVPPPVPPAPKASIKARDAEGVVVVCTWEATRGATGCIVEMETEAAGGRTSDEVACEGKRTRREFRVVDSRSCRFRVAATNEHGRSAMGPWSSTVELVAQVQSRAPEAGKAKRRTRRAEDAKRDEGKAAPAPSAAEQKRRVQQLLRAKQSGVPSWVYVVGAGVVAAAVWWFWASDE
uniref:Uncharacterized protein n=1 Tax=Bicosoecida sp. CB-2014 TaxID=1486930 RepID=A0A7S1CQW2_9STRA|mmetsp:Transcript_7221/g.25804  ORF Transcript_7221/g.25804 Transcript_7221/m.25804 type:complete len:1536 (+) Transcript_7221:172-4779(+)